MYKVNYLFIWASFSLIAACNSKTVQTETVSPKRDSIFSVKLDTTQQKLMNEEGLNTDYYNNGKEKIKGIIQNGKREGLWQAWYENGNLWSEAEYSKGISNGKSVTYFENGKIRFEGMYHNGKKTGVWKYYDDSGSLLKTVNAH